jgi:hypothetical protein
MRHTSRTTRLNLLPAPIFPEEKVSLGVRAPITSSIAAMGVGDMLALIIGEKLHKGELKQVFQCYHPGGAIRSSAQD